MFRIRACALNGIFVVAILVSVVARTQGAEAISSRRLLEVADLSIPVVSPDGLSVAFRLDQPAVERNSVDTIWYVQDLSGRTPPRRVADGGFAIHDTQGVPVPPTAVWSSDGQWIYYKAMIDGKIDVWRAAEDGSGAQAVTDDLADVRDFSLSPDGRTLNYSVGATREQVTGAEQAEYDSGTLVNQTVPIGQPLFRSGYIDGRKVTLRLRDSEILRSRLLSYVKDRWKAIDLVARTVRDLDPNEIAGVAGVALKPSVDGVPEGSTLARDLIGQRVAYITRKNGQRDDQNTKLSMRSLRSGDAQDCQAELCLGKNITGILWRPGRNEVLFTVTDPSEGHAQAIYSWDVKSGLVHVVVRSRGLLNGGRDVHSSCGLSALALVCVAAEANNPPRLERVDLHSGHRAVLFEPNAALALDIAATTPARLIRWKAPNGQLFTGQFFAARRNSGRLPPLFVSYYTCPGFVRGGMGDEWPMAVLASHGIAAFCINYPPGSRPDAVERYDEGLTAVKSAVALLASTGEIDQTRIGMGGLSFGAEVTLWTVMNSNLITAASLSSPSFGQLAYSLLSMYSDTYFPRLRKFWQLGSPAETPERWQKLSPSSNLNKIRSPVLMQFPEQEYIYSLDYAIPLTKDDRAELYVFSDEAHIKIQPKHKLAVYDRNLDWFMFWLMDYESPDPAKQEQYGRWRKMKAARVSKQLVSE